VAAAAETKIVKKNPRQEGRGERQEDAAAKIVKTNP